MENTLENKAKFFALYWGQNCAWMKRPHEIEYLEKVSYYSITWISYLELKPLSSIIDEDFQKIVDIKNQKLLPGTIRRKNIISDYLIQEQVDFLRSRGYAMTWMGLSVKKLIEYGWIKLKK